MFTDIIELDMINFKVTNYDNSALTIVKPVGKPIPIQLGETLQAVVTDVLPGGGVTLKIKDNFINAKTELMLQKDMSALFKVLDTPVSGKELKLQFIGYTEKPPEETKQSEQMGEALNRVLKDMTDTLSKNGDKIGPKTIENLLKALPSESSTLPKEIRAQLQDLLKASLKSTGQGIQSKLSDFLNTQLPESLSDHPLVQNLKNVMVNIDKLMTTKLGNALQDTGVAFEAKLKSIAGMLSETAQKADAGNPDTYILKAKDLLAGKVFNEPGLSQIKNDLKASLLQLKELLSEKGAAEFSKALGVNSDAQKDGLSVRNADRTIDGLLRDIETFQSLSKATDSFYTFLPVNWRELKEGNIAFKKGTGGEAGTPFTCRINLDLENHGKLNMLVLMHKEEFFVSFKSEDPAFQSTLNSNLDELKDSFREKGMYLKGAAVLALNDTSFENAESLEPFEKIVSIKA